LFENKFNEVELKIKGISTISTLRSQQQTKDSFTNSTQIQDDIQSALKKELLLCQEGLKQEVEYNTEQMESKLSTFRKSIDHRFQDYQSLMDEKMKMIDKKILESFSERSYQFHEKNSDFGDTFKERSTDNRLKQIENKIERIELVTNSGVTSNSNRDFYNVNFRQ